ncbi:MAG: L-2-hydroxyglutarate oxidase, partial [Planctomycetota bacterium]
RCGKVVVATDEGEASRLAELEERGRSNGLRGLRRLSADELKAHEPHVAGVGGLHVPDTGIVDFVAVTCAFGDVVREQGGRILTGARVESVHPQPDGFVLTTARAEVRCQTLVNCAGLQSDRVARMCGVQPGSRIIPFRGEYRRLAAHRTSLVRNLIYPVPDPRFPFLGVHLTRRIGGAVDGRCESGGVEVGPTAVPAFNRHGYRRWRPSPRDAMETLRYPGFWRMALRDGRTGLGELWRSWSRGALARAAQRLVPELTAADLRPAEPGIRAQAVDHSGRLLDDFHIVKAERMVHVINAPSPAATSSISIGRYIAGEVGWGEGTKGLRD